MLSGPIHTGHLFPKNFGVFSITTIYPVIFRFEVEILRLMIGIGRAITSVVFCSEECDKVLGWGQKPDRART